MGTMKILLIDDDRDFSQSLCEVLYEANNEVILSLLDDIITTSHSDVFLICLRIAIPSSL